MCLRYQRLIITITMIVFAKDCYGWMLRNERIYPSDVWLPIDGAFFLFHLSPPSSHQNERAM
jgi:hypothetical protein